MFDRHFYPKQYKGSETRTARVARAPRRTNDESTLIEIERYYMGKGFDAREARFKARTHHTVKR
jgi:hypothetical protein